VKRSQLPTTTCAQCGAVLLAGQGVAVEDRVFCDRCYEALANTVRRALDEQTRASPTRWHWLARWRRVGRAVAWYLFVTLTGILLA